MTQKPDPSAGRRAFTRVSFDVKAQLRIDQQAYGADRIRDISLGGCFLYFLTGIPWDQNADIDVGRPCTVRIVLTGTTPGMTVEIGGKISRFSKEGIAVTFTTAAPESLFHLQNIIRYNAVDADTIEEEFRGHLAPDNK